MSIGSFAPLTAFIYKRVGDNRLCSKVGWWAGAGKLASPHAQFHFYTPSKKYPACVPRHSATYQVPYLWVHLLQDPGLGLSRHNLHCIQQCVWWRFPHSSISWYEWFVYNILDVFIKMWFLCFFIMQPVINRKWFGIFLKSLSQYSYWIWGFWLFDWVIFLSNTSVGKMGKMSLKVLYKILYKSQDFRWVISYNLHWIM